MSTTDPNASVPPPPPSAMSDNQLAMIVYALYLAAFFNGVTAIIGVIIAYVKDSSADPVLHSHYQFQIRTFWIGMLYVVVGLVLTLVLVGIAVLIWAFVWWLVRSIKGLLALNENRPIQNPASWMFG
jgi:uncharacterized membrane protein